MKKIIKILILLCAAALMLSSCGKEVKEPAPVIETVRVTFPEGTAVSQMALMLEENRVCSAADFMAAAGSTEIAAKYGINIPSPQNRGFLLEGYLFPDTYDFYVGENAQSVVGRFLKNMNLKLESIRSECESSGFTVDEILSLASVIQEEAGDPSEMNKVSSVLNNRLNSSKYKRLQCDVTINYLKNHIKPYFTEERYEELVPLYNTYKCYGLPEGPITNPGMEAIEAALNPVESDWYFFISDNNGEYHYAETWEEHQENCREAGI